MESHDPLLSLSLFHLLPPGPWRSSLEHPATEVSEGNQGIRAASFSASRYLPQHLKKHPIRGFPLPLQEFCQRAELLAELELPCTLHVSNQAIQQTCSGIIREIEHTAEHLGISGENFSLRLCKQNIDSIWLVDSSRPEAMGIAVEIYGVADGLIARISGSGGEAGGTVWDDVMANPCLSVI